MRRSFRILGAAALMSMSSLSSSSFAEPTAATISVKMADVTDELNRKETGPPVQTEQKSIVSDLDELIASLEKKAAQAGEGIKNVNPTNGMDDSRISRGPGGMGTLTAPSDNGKDWGKLSGRERDRILQSMSEGFPPEYRTVLERYYRRLADEKPSTASSKTPAAKAMPAKP